MFREVDVADIVGVVTRAMLAMRRRGVQIMMLINIECVTFEFSYHSTRHVSFTMSVFPHDLEVKRRFLELLVCDLTTLNPTDVLRFANMDYYEQFQM